MHLLQLQISHPKAIGRRTHLVRTGVPIPKEVLHTVGSTALSIDSRLAKEVYASAAVSQNIGSDDIEHIGTALSRWPDGSIRWLLLEFLLTLESDQPVCLTLRRVDAAGSEDECMRGDIQTTGGKFVMDDVAFDLDTVPGEPLAMTMHEHSRHSLFTSSCLQMISNSGKAYPLRILQQYWLQNDSGLSATLHTLGEFDSGAPGKCINVSIVQNIYKHAALSQVEICLHNPAAAVHPGGLWDLGDPGSICFASVALDIAIPGNMSTQWQSDEHQPWQQIGEDQYLLIEQHGSGGVNWRSPVHMDANGKCTVRQGGFTIHREQERIALGGRCAPVLAIKHADTQWQLRPQQFWQRFPKALHVTPEKLSFHILPFSDAAPHELQAGESCTTRFDILYSTKDCELTDTDSQLDIHIVDLHESRRAVRDERYGALLAKSLSEAQGFLAKREQVDEYGWRNFGELYADHETWNQQYEGIFVSHYNNQYDVIDGFAQQYRLTGDARWFELMRDLAQHVLDIDLYRTSDDRPEYNNGLFWHTDHYVQAGTASHRTYSKRQQSQSHHVEGGGPGGQHCYSSGLKQYYQLTGCQRARTAVLAMGDWIAVVYDGSGSVLECARQTIKRHFPEFLGILKGRRVLRYRYPLDRGTGNYIRCMLDCFELDAQQSYLDKAGAIIRDTASAGDDINKRNLQDIEGTWFYTVFLQAVVQYLDVKRQHDQYDEHFRYALDTFLHYANWMVEYEAPYLESADSLEYPNDTWVAQDIRKAGLLHAAYRYSEIHRGRYLSRAQFFKDYVLGALEVSETVHYTRIQAILLQNHDPAGFVWQEGRFDSDGVHGKRGTGHSHVTTPDTDLALASVSQLVSPYATAGTLLHRLAMQWWHCLRHFSLNREVRWLRHRIPALNRRWV